MIDARWTTVTLQNQAMPNFTKSVEKETTGDKMARMIP